MIKLLTTGLVAGKYELVQRASKMENHLLARIRHRGALHTCQVEPAERLANGLCDLTVKQGL